MAAQPAGKGGAYLPPTPGRQTLVGKPEWLAEWLRHERALSHHLSQQVAALLTLVNGCPAPHPSVIHSEHSRKVTPTAPTCLWRYCDIDYHWRGDCGAAWVMTNEQSPQKNDMLYCPKCGRELLATYEPKEPKDE